MSYGASGQIEQRRAAKDNNCSPLRPDKLLFFSQPSVVVCLRSVSILEEWMLKPPLKETNGNDAVPARSNQAPTISLPKGGGAIRGIGEKFAANPVTGTGSMTMPIATSPGRAGFAPQLALTYDSGAGNGTFGLGWHPSAPSITCKTEKGLPRYLKPRYGAATKPDVFILSGAEDLVPVLEHVKDSWQCPEPSLRTIAGRFYEVQRYRPRVEGLFARIERWANSAEPTDVFWRSITRDNLTTLYGKSAASRIADPEDPSRIFSWLICESHDDKGNAMLYEYVAEDSRNVDLSQANERNRTDASRSANRYLKRIKYGSKTPCVCGEDLSNRDDWLFEVVFDYGEDHLQSLSQPSEEPQFMAASLTPAMAWPARLDAFSSYRSTFEVRTYRLCRRVLMFHHFPDGNNGEPGYEGLVRSTDFTYDENPIATKLRSVTHTGYSLDKATNRYLARSMPPVELTYSEARIDHTIHDIDSESLENLPVGLDRQNYQWVDLDGEGISGILTEQATGWFYKRNLSPAPKLNGKGSQKEGTTARFGPFELVASKPILSLADGHAQFMDLAGDGQPDLVTFESPSPGFYERTDEAGWETFRAFRSFPNLDPRDPNLKFLDLDGDGHADILISENDVFRWHTSLAEDGFGPSKSGPKPFDEEHGPALVFADPTQSIFLADMSGDGLTDIVRIRNCEVCYWPNRGFCRFGAKITVDNVHWFDRSESFDPRRIRLADIDGSGTTDILYLRSDAIAIYRNQPGNSLGDGELLTSFPPTNNLTSITAVDLLGNGTACLVWSSPLAGDAGQQMRYIDLMGGQKPHLLIRAVNNFGAETAVSYTRSGITFFYLREHGSFSRAKSF